MDRDQIRAVALDNACRMTASGVVHSTDVLEVAARFETWLTRDVPSTSTGTVNTSTSTSTDTDTDTAPCLGCEHAPHVGRCPQLLKGPFGPWRCPCDLDTRTDMVRPACAGCSHAVHAGRCTRVLTTGAQCACSRTDACTACGHSWHGVDTCGTDVPEEEGVHHGGVCACTGPDTVCSWNPATSGPDCDWSRDCPVHGTPATDTDTDTDTPMREWEMCACGHSGAWHSVTGHECRGVVGHQPCKCPKRGTLVPFGKLPDTDTDTDTDLLLCAGHARGQSFRHGCQHVRGEHDADGCRVTVEHHGVCPCTRPGGN